MRKKLAPITSGGKPWDAKKERRNGTYLMVLVAGGGMIMAALMGPSPEEAAPGGAFPAAVKQQLTVPVPRPRPTIIAPRRSDRPAAPAQDKLPQANMQ